MPHALLRIMNLSWHQAQAKIGNHIFITLNDKNLVNFLAYQTLQVLNGKKKCLTHNSYLKNQRQVFKLIGHRDGKMWLSCTRSNIQGLCLESNNPISTFWHLANFVLKVSIISLSSIVTYLIAPFESSIDLSLFNLQRFS